MTLLRSSAIRKEPGLNVDPVVDGVVDANVGTDTLDPELALEVLGTLGIDGVVNTGAGVFGVVTLALDGAVKLGLVIVGILGKIGILL